MIAVAASLLAAWVAWVFESPDVMYAFVGLAVFLAIKTGIEWWSRVFGIEHLHLHWRPRRSRD